MSNKLVATHAKADAVLLIITTTLVILGFVTMASASTSIAESPFYYVNRQAIALLIGAVMGWIAFNVPYSVWQHNRQLLFLVVIASLVMVLLVGQSIRGAKRWIEIGGQSLQVIEFVKVAMILYVAAYLTQYRNRIQQDVKRLMALLALSFIVVALALSQPDFGNAVIIMAVVVIMAFMSGIKARWLALLFVLGAIGLALMIWLEPYRLMRVLSFLDGIRDPLADSNDSGYQRSRSLSAIARGGFFGQGLGDSLFKHGKLPFAHSDFIFSIYAEELGLLGVLVLLFLFGLFVVRAFQIGLRAEAIQRYFVANVCFGIGVLFALQWIFNIMVCLSLLPTKGMALPFFSVGGSSMIASLIAVGILARAKHEVDLMDDPSQSEWFEEMDDFASEPEVTKESKETIKSDFAYAATSNADQATIDGYFSDEPTALEHARSRLRS